MSAKKNVLALLESERGKNISGEHIAKSLNVSRNAVWKAVGALKKDGYRILASTNKGYCLCEDNDILSLQGVRAFLREKSAADKIKVCSSLESTNKTAKEMAVSGAGHGTVIIADSQTAGRGRYGRSFFSPPGHGIYMSLILRPGHFSFGTPTLATAFAAVAVCEAIEAVSEKNPKIKWVNDVFLGGKKICGILTEAITDFESGNIGWIVLGAGINFRAPGAGYPEELRAVAGAVFEEDEPAVTRNRLAAEIINRILTPEGPAGEAQTLFKYKQRLFMLGRKVLINSMGESYEATAADIDDAGRLVVKKDTGEILSLSSGEVSLHNCHPDSNL